MITCEFCGTQAEQHDHWRHEIMARVAALEDVVTREPPAEQPNAVHLKGCGAILSVRQPRGMCGWIFADGSQSLCAKCKEAAVPAEQPSRQETGGGEHMNCAHSPSGDDACRDRAKAKAAEQARVDKDSRVYPCKECGVMRSMAEGGTTFTVCDECWDKTYPPKPAEPSGTGQLASAPAGFCVVGQSGPGVVQSKGLWIRRARDYRDGSPANGEPRQITMPGSLGGVWDAGEYDILEPIAEPPALAVETLSERIRANIPAANGAVLGMKVTGDVLAEMADEVAALEARLAQAKRERDEWRPRYEAAAADARTLREAWARAERERDELGRQVEQMAAHVAGTRYNGAVKEREEATATIERVAYNTPEAVARSESDVTVLIELRRVQKERDDATAKLYGGCESCTDSTPILCATCADRSSDEATARERERCLEVVETYEPRRDVTADWSYQGALARVSERIRSGANAIAPKCDPDPPREVAPDRAQAGSGGPYERCLAVRYGSGSCAKPNGHAMEHRDDDGNTW